MAINIFAGARRLAMVVAGAIVIGLGFLIFSDPIDTHLYYEVSGPGVAPVRTLKDSCADRDQYASKHVELSGMTVTATICFKASEMEKGEWGIPTQTIVSDGKTRWWIYERYSPEAMKYTERMVKAFTVPKSDIADAEALYWPLTKGRFAEFGKLLAWCLSALFVLTTLIGWIVRGFAGIPMGQDSPSYTTKPTLTTPLVLLPFLAAFGVWLAAYLFGDWIVARFYAEKPMVGEILHWFVLIAGPWGAYWGTAKKVDAYIRRKNESAKQNMDRDA